MGLGKLELGCHITLCDGRKGWDAGLIQGRMVAQHREETIALWGNCFCTSRRYHGTPSPLETSIMSIVVDLQAPQTRVPLSRSQGIVAIVDDDPHISRALGMWLEMHDLRATHHISAESLLHAIQQEEGRLTLHIGVRDPVVFPLVGAVLDLNLPGATGFELARSLRELAPELPIAIITALRDEERIRYGQPPPGVCCLKKPFDIDALEDALFPLLH
jgi:CheY-like chemotaxis protein